MSDKITVTLDLDALKKHARLIADQNGGTLEGSSGDTVGDLARVFDAFYGLFNGPNEAFADAMMNAITTLEMIEEG